jgi:hypothetical protein
LSIFLIKTCDLQKPILLGEECELSGVDVVIKLYYEEVLDEKLSSPFKLHAFMDKVMD